MTKIYIPDGPHPPKVWREWRKSTRQRIRDITPWARYRSTREDLIGVAVEPVNFPFYEDELAIFPRNINIRVLAELVNHPERRKSDYERRLRAMVGNFKAKARGQYTFLLLPQSFEKILARIETRHTKITPEVLRVAKEYFFKGRRAHEVGSKITIRTLTSYLQRAEEELDILGDRREILKIATRTLDISYSVLRYAREVGIDFRRYFRDRIF